MKLKHRHIISIILLLGGLLGFVSCEKESLQLSREEDNSVYLSFHAGVVGGFSRAGVGEEGTDGMISQLLIVIVSKGPGDDGEWKVEHNYPVGGASTGISLSDEYTFKVDPGCQKRIYLIANHGSLKDMAGNQLDFSNQAFIPDATTGNVPVEEYVFKPEYTPGTIPMTAVYDVTVPEREELTNGEYKLGTLYVVRAATKFSFNFTNKSAQRTITVTGVNIGSVITDQMYLMPHVKKNSEGKYWVVDQDKASSLPLTDKSWIDWMVEEAEKKKNTDQYQWLTDYEVPTEDTKIHSHTFTPQLELAPMTGDTPYEAASNDIYLPESKTVINGNTLGLQEYSVTIQTNENDGETKTYTAPLPNLSSLFRNTHVIVNITFTDAGISSFIYVRPWHSISHPQIIL